MTGVVGVPPISPVEAFSAKPAGRVPAVNCQVYAPKPPVACNACEYKAFTCPLGKDAVRIVSGATTDTFATLPVKPWADAVMVADARFGPPVIWLPLPEHIIACLELQCVGVAAIQRRNLLLHLVRAVPQYRCRTKINHHVDN